MSSQAQYHEPITPEADLVLRTPDPPGAVAFSDELRRQLLDLSQERHLAEAARTRHQRADGLPRYTNRLALESSPYLRQHAHNPVNWYPWGDEAFALAAELDRPVFLSVGYSTCHWCHVMEEESFEDLEIAEYLNEHFVSVKVDREQRPDVDDLYMTAVRYFNGGSGGWPMTLFLGSDRLPFFGATYIPARDGDRVSSIGLLTLLNRLIELYGSDDRSRLTAQAMEAARLIAESVRPARPGDVPDHQAIATAVSSFSSGFDNRFGGMMGGTKFPTPSIYRLLLRYYRRTGDARSLEMVTTTLDRMARAGIYDQLGGGFHRYATDRQWQVPHFEKMLYDNAQLTSLYLEAYQVTGNEEYGRVARETLDYVVREMTAPESGFYSATDADSEGEEGLFFIWELEEINADLELEQAEVLIAHYGVSSRGNFEGQNILHVARPLESVAADLELTTSRADELLQSARARLYALRLERIPPSLDDKILTSWNGLMLSAFAQGSLVLAEHAYLERALAAAQFIYDNLWREGRLYRSYHQGDSETLGFLDDYAFLIAGLIDLFEASGQAAWLEWALTLQGVLDEHFVDDEGGGYFFTSDEHEELMARAKPDYDGAEPTGNSVAVENLLRFSELTAEPDYRQVAEGVFAAFAGSLTTRSTSLPRMLAALDFYLDEPWEIVLVSSTEGGDAAPFLEQLSSSFLPNRVLVKVRQGGDLSRLLATVPLVEYKVAQGGITTAYVCKAGACDRPTSDPETFAQQIVPVAPYGL